MPNQALQSLMNRFVQAQRQEKGERTYETYGRKIFVFMEYIERRGINDENYRPFLHTAQISDILSALKYYVVTYGIEFKSTTDIFMSVLSVFFKYIKKNEGIENEFFNEDAKGEELKTAYDELVKELKLNESRQATPLANDECEKLISLCNEKIDIPSKDAILNGENNGVYTSFLSSIITKFVLLFGMKNKEFNELSIDAYDSVLNKISIRGYTVHLPDGLALQMMKYYEIREKVIPATISDNRLFVDISPKQKLDNAKMFYVLKGVTGNAKAMSVAKYAIMQMLKNGVPFSLVMDFTGYSRDVCGHCQELVDEENGIFQLSEKNKKLDSSVRQSKIFDIM